MKKGVVVGLTIVALVVGMWVGAELALNLAMCQ